MSIRPETGLLRPLEALHTPIRPSQAPFGPKTANLQVVCAILGIQVSPGNYRGIPLIWAKRYGLCPGRSVRIVPTVSPAAHERGLCGTLCNSRSTGTPT